MEGNTLNNFALTMISLGVLFGLGALIYAVRRGLTGRGGEVGGWTVRGSRQTIFAVARSTLAEGVRARVASGFALLILISVPFFFFTAEGDGTIKGRVQMFMAYSLGFSAFVLSLLTIMFSCRSLSKEIESRQIFGLVTKPVPRWQILVGKWTGIMMMNVCLLSLVGLGTYGGTMLILGRFKSTLYEQLSTDGGLTPQQAERAVDALNNIKGKGAKGFESPVITAMKEATGMSRQAVGDVLLRLPESTRVDLRRFDELRRQVLVARAAVSPVVDEDEIRKEVQARYEYLEKEQRLPAAISKAQVMEALQQEAVSSRFTVLPMTDKQWTLKGPPPDKRSDRIMSLRYKIDSHSGLPALREVYMGILLEEDNLLCTWRIGSESEPNPHFILPPILARTIQEEELPIDAVEADGTIELALLNEDPRRAPVFFDPVGGIEVMYVVGSFELNLFQTCLAILIPLVCLASFGVCASTFLTFPVASLILVCLYLISISMGFVAESLAVTTEYYDPSEEQGVMFEIRKSMVEGLGWVLSIGDLDPIGSLMQGRVVGWPRLGEAFWKFVLVKSGLAMLLGVIVFRRRELAAVIV